MFMIMSFTFGGFLFYASVVVPNGTRVLGPTQQGFVTRHVTQAMNVAHLVTIGVLLVDYWWARNRRRPSANRSLAVSIGILAACNATLFWLHTQLESHLDPNDFAVHQAEVFYGKHRIYLWVSTLQWLASLPVMWILANAEYSGSINQQMDGEH